MCRLAKLVLCNAIITVLVFSGTDLYARGNVFQHGRRAVGSASKTIKRQSGNAGKSTRNMGSRAAKSVRRKGSGAAQVGQKISKRTQAKAKSAAGSATKNTKSTASKAQKRTQVITRPVSTASKKVPTVPSPKPLDAVRKPVSLPKLNPAFGSNTPKPGGSGIGGSLNGAKPNHQAMTPVKLGSKLPPVPKVPRTMTEGLSQRQAGIEGVPGLSSNGKSNGGNGTSNSSGAGPKVGAGGFSVPVPKGTPFLDHRPGAGDDSDRPDVSAPVLGGY